MLAGRIPAFRHNSCQGPGSPPRSRTPSPGSQRRQRLRRRFSITATSVTPTGSRRARWHAEAMRLADRVQAALLKNLACLFVHATIRLRYLCRPKIQQSPRACVTARSDHLIPGTSCEPMADIRPFRRHHRYDLGRVAALSDVSRSALRRDRPDVLQQALYDRSHVQRDPPDPEQGNAAGHRIGQSLHAAGTPSYSARAGRRRAGSGTPLAACTSAIRTSRSRDSVSRARASSSHATQPGAIRQQAAIYPATRRQLPGPEAADRP